MTIQMIFSSILFSIVYIFIIAERFNKTIIALLGATILIFSGILDEKQALSYIDFNTIGLLIGMMIIVIIIKHSGLFEYIAVTQAKRVKGNPIAIMIMLAIITAIGSAFLDNVTTIMLVVPVTLVILKILNLDPIPFIIIEILASNIGGTATLIGDPPNLMIGSANNIGFLDFIINLAPPAIIIFGLLMIFIKFKYSKHFDSSNERIQELYNINDKTLIKDKSLMIKGLSVLGIVIIGFFVHSTIHINSSTIAIAGASILLLITGRPVHDTLKEIEWETIFFFIGLFVMVGGLEQTGVIHALAEGLVDITNGNYILLVLGVLWVSAFASAFIDNIPFVATMIPLIKTIIETPGVSPMPLWWALALGACLGGNGTMVGASANVIAGGLLKSKGYSISFKRFFKTGFPIMIVSIVISSIYILIIYLLKTK